MSGTETFLSGTTTTSSWQDVLSLLTRPNSSKKDKNKDNRSCPLLDTVFYGQVGDAKIEWFYTTKSGAVARKSDESVSSEAVLSR
jgi:hypothetical protein